MVRPPGTTGEKPLTESGFGDGGMWEDLDEDGETKNAMSFKRTLMMMMMMMDIKLNCFSYGCT
jgi:hypothetical protein